METVAAIKTLIQQLAQSTDQFGRAEINDALRELQYSLETPFDTVMRMSLDTCQVAVARIGSDLGLFKHLSQCASPQSAEELADHLGCGRELMSRLLRYMASVRMVQQTDDIKYISSNITQTLAVPGLEAGMRHAFENLWPVLMALPDFLAERKYPDIVDAKDTAFQKAFNTDQDCFHWLATQPTRIANFKVLLTDERTPNFLSTFPLEKELGSWSAEPEKALFVDIGGGMGHACIRLREKYPNQPGRVILQDLPPVLQAAQATLPLSGIESMPHNFHTPQPVQGAKFYFLRLILRDFPDHQALEILQNIVPAMDAESRIVIDDGVPPEKGARWAETGTDICIMSALGSKERTQRQWEELAAKAGLQLQALYQYTWPVVNAAMVFSLQ
ncbi:putative O-methyltransferase [Aspergillus flavus]|uniref:O-methyltransferase lepI n=3 Tax=Aspergillus flavus (strain ATCC 200026 / FGSC A1120 / IAM 13836 / NRRL 3357 / JCM 12722 / SRRC 167) TaxID=332952 RepID=LEPI_ASPFN|nr:RecName: Full=O-methyltransferase lepI; AltName: Full=Leporins biosynthesis protein I [Aspergillus flavus NRRL3357]5ZZD_A Chain A, O-methyltransferase lepI [Aspergillus flavus NRRL3357]5ZZD_B Chain B, O-methyltransferase lepI [Aspergillus flavus NRRL3357]6J1O_A Chain A, O-methyltransferase lepI [Aspergillus flavus NRRL3357]6J1O_B Chain B, O-methyltransferase lepI [Aspergillus flavus NRRL3357]6J24_A Chain A, O-methyltransferase [Aspergillus flavus]6J24_B Chain B, O-methyltransferase [Asperg